MSRTAVLVGTNTKPQLELYFSKEDDATREWVTGLPNRRWNPQRRCWVVTGVTEAPDRLLAEHGFDLIGYDGELCSADDACRPYAMPSNLHSGYPVAVYPRLAARASLEGHIGPDALWREEEHCWLVKHNVVVQDSKAVPWAWVDERIIRDAPIQEENPNTLIYDHTIDGLRGVPVVDLETVKPDTAVSMQAVGINNVFDLLHRVPRRYIDLSNPQPVNGAEPGETIAILGTIIKIDVPQFGNSMAKATIEDSEGTRIWCRWFNAGWNIRKLRVGAKVLIHGKVEEFTTASGWTGRAMTNPLTENLTNTARKGMLGIYAASGKHELTTWQTFSAAHEAACRLGPMIDPVPEQILDRRGLVRRSDAFRKVHAPNNPQEAEAGRTRLAYDELLRLQLALLVARTAQHSESGLPQHADRHLLDQMLGKLPFPLTGAQVRSINEILADMASNHSMHRLLQGDVGAGKAQPLSSMVLTATGWRRMGDMTIGERLVTPDGSFSHVVGIYPQGIRSVLRLTFSDGSVVRADRDHLWQLIDGTLVTAADMLRDFAPDRYELPLPGPIAFNGYTARERTRTLYAGLWKRNALVDDRGYITLPEEQDMIDLARSVGCTAETVDGVTRIAPHPSLPPFRDNTGRVADVLPRKTVRSIEPDGHEPTQCILVDHPDHLYITDDYTVTHNTLVALAGMLAAVESHNQAALVVPTEILANQHFEEISSRVEGIQHRDGRPVRVELLTNKVTGKRRKATLAALAEGEVDIVVGTQAVLQEAVTFKSLGLAVVDEQHRFGVEQRNALKAKGAQGRLPDMLYATATPIPRSAVMTVFGDLDVSLLDELPPGRTPVKTVHLEEAPLDDMHNMAWAQIRAEVSNGRQAFVVCPLVTTSATKEAAAAEATGEDLAVGALTGLRVGVVTGKQKPDERHEIMGRFEKGELDVLVATTVVEVGVNVPNATSMVILGADKFGIAQLHQLRGRVGRGQHAGTCFLVAQPKTKNGKERIEALCASTDGFKLAEMDLAIRGTGQLLGGAQSGAARDLKVADVLNDTTLVAWAKEDAATIVTQDPLLARRPQLRDEITRALGEEAAQWLTSA